MSKLFMFSVISILSLSGHAQGKRPGGEDQEKVKAAVEACFKEKGISRPEKGVRLSEESRSLIQSCMKAKGFEDFKGPRRPDKKTN